MSLDPEHGVGTGRGGGSIAFSPDFVERVFTEANRRRKSSRRLRALGTGAALLVALVAVGRGPLQLGRARSASDEATVLAMGDLDLTASELGDELAAEEDLDADPGSYFVPEASSGGPVDEAEESEIALFEQE